MEPRPWHAHYDPGVPAALDFREATLPQVLRATSAARPDATALIFENARLSYAELQDEVDRLATALVDLGVTPDAKVAVHLPNLPQTVIAAQAVLACGAQVVMTNPLYVERELVHQWHDAEVEVAITADFLYQRVLAPIRQKLGVREYIIASIPEYLRFPLNLLAPFKLRRADPPAIAPMPKGKGLHPFRALIKGTSPRPPEVSGDWNRLAALQYTGGTTGVSKAAMLTHRNLVCNVQQLVAWLGGFDGDEVVLAVLPYFHIFGFTVCMNLPLAVGGTIVVMPNPRLIPKIVEGIEKHRATFLAGVPTMFAAINALKSTAEHDLSSVRAVFSGSAPLPEDTLRRFEEITSSVIFEGYGLTETSPGSHVNPLKRTRKINSVGMPLPSTDARLVDPETGADAAPGESGELLIKGPQVMQGYWKRPEETAQTLQDGWLHTGDLATMDEDGYFRIVGRKKDMIIAGGYNIFPDEVDRVLMDHPAVAEACTIGVPHPRRGETVKAFVVLTEPGAATQDDLDTHCRERLAAYKVPRAYEFRDDLPKSHMLKLLRRELRDQEVAKMEAAKGA